MGGFGEDCGLTAPMRRSADFFGGPCFPGIVAVATDGGGRGLAACPWARLGMFSIPLPLRSTTFACSPITSRLLQVILSPSLLARSSFASISNRLSPTCRAVASSRPTKVSACRKSADVGLASLCGIVRRPAMKGLVRVGGEQRSGFAAGGRVQFRALVEYFVEQLAVVAGDVLYIGRILVTPLEMKLRTPA